MRSRVADSGGVLSITSDISEGTTLKARIPLAVQEL